MIGSKSKDVVHERLNAVKGVEGSVSGLIYPNWPLQGILGTSVNWDMRFERLLRELRDC